MSRYIELLAALATALVLAFGLILGEGSLRERLSHGRSLLLRWTVYTALDYGLMLLSIGLVAVARHLGTRFSLATATMFLFDLASAGLLWAICLRSNQDLTLGREYRRATGLLRRRSWLAGAGAVLLLSVKSVVWDGPERMLEFLHLELNGRRALGFALLAGLALLQALFWTAIYWTGYDALQR
jgi:hypothetical protein